MKNLHFSLASIPVNENISKCKNTSSFESWFVSYEQVSDTITVEQVQSFVLKHLLLIKQFQAHDRKTIF